MSSAAITWARRQQIAAPHLRSLVNALAMRANQGGLTFVSQATLAQDVAVCDRQIRKSLAILEALGVIVRQARSRGAKGRLSDNITLSLHREFSITASDIKKAAAQRFPTGTSAPVRPEIATGTVVPAQPELGCRGSNNEGIVVPSQGTGFNCSGVADSTHTRAAEIVPFPRRATA